MESLVREAGFGLVRMDFTDSTILPHKVIEACESARINEQGFLIAGFRQ
ncbi:hypothetical protein HYU11_04480 [Candidatus Woesearchaeota archaeon]|nr:hypothetical protein [Candidatus Woesearchaeota archaeon]